METPDRDRTAARAMDPARAARIEVPDRARRAPAGKAVPCSPESVRGRNGHSARSRTSAWASCWRRVGVDPTDARNMTIDSDDQATHFLGTDEAPGAGPTVGR